MYISVYLFGRWFSEHDILSDAVKKSKKVPRHFEFRVAGASQSGSGSKIIHEISIFGTKDLWPLVSSTLKTRATLSYQMFLLYETAKTATKIKQPPESPGQNHMELTSAHPKTLTPSSVECGCLKSPLQECYGIFLLIISSSLKHYRNCPLLDPNEDSRSPPRSVLEKATDIFSLKSASVWKTHLIFSNWR